MMLRTLLATLAAVCLLPDEGQWLPTQIREMDWEALQRRGMQLSRDEFWHPERGGILSAAVQINGCTAAFVSDQGLLVTNHHCGFGAISALSTTESNYLTNGFAAADRASELPAPGMRAYVLKRIENVTDAVHEAQRGAENDFDRWSITQQTIASLVQKAEASEANTQCFVASFLEGKEYHLYYRTEIRDVRLVYAPPSAIGNFGGEVDNWEWPRHSGDFSFFRAYVAPDGAVREFASDNVPYRPEHFLAVSTEGVKEGDLTLIMGYPGRTQRYKSSRGVATQQTFVYPTRNRMLTATLEVLNSVAELSDERALALADRIKSLANVQKNAKGMIFGLEQNAVVHRKLLGEADLREWIGKDEGRRRKWGTVIDEMLAMDEEEASTIERDTLLGLTRWIAPDVAVLGALIDASRAVTREGGVPPGLQQALGNDALGTDLELLQLPLLQVILDELASMSPAQGFPELAFLGTDGLDQTAFEALLRDTKMFDGKARADLFAAGAAAVAASTDPMIVIARTLAAELDQSGHRQQERLGKMLDVGRRWIEAQEAFRGKSFYPDANSTLRVSIAEVRGYEPRDGMIYMPQTTVGGVLQKERGEDPFASPPALLDAAKTRYRTRWFDPRLHDVPVCFLTNGDTTGGNSGSPVIDGRGRLVGLNFDRVFEAVAGDFGWNPDRSRNIVVDVRYLLWVVEAVFPSPNLLQELGCARR
jgi:hypothetical protein